jgi:hypothetical protein
MKQVIQHRFNIKKKKKKKEKIKRRKKKATVGGVTLFISVTVSASHGPSSIK